MENSQKHPEMTFSLKKLCTLFLEANGGLYYFVASRLDSYLGVWVILIDIESTITVL